MKVELISKEYIPSLQKTYSKIETVDYNVDGYLDLYYINT
jgi:hypothetical protein